LLSYQKPSVADIATQSSLSLVKYVKVKCIQMFFVRVVDVKLHDVVTNGFLHLFYTIFAAAISHKMIINKNQI
jgi:hypothetical protein